MTDAFVLGGVRTHLEIVGQMIVIGVGMGVTTAPATEAIMGVVSKEKAGSGSAVNDATRELGATLGIAVIGSILRFALRLGRGGRRFRCARLPVRWTPPA